MNSKYKNFEIETDSRGVVTVTLDVPGRPMNVFTREVMEELDSIVDELESNSLGVNLVLFQSGKESGFLAGADVSVIAEIDSPSMGVEMIEAGQMLFQRVESLSMPTVAVIHGPCLGGGLEFSLACNYRVARANSSTKIGLPEIKLGLIPGWGGTQRLPKTVGLTNALPLILTGKHLGADEALKIGLIDCAISPERWDADLAVFLEDVLAGVTTVGDQRRLRDRLLEATRLGRALIFHMTSKSIRSKAKHFPALDSAVKAIRRGYDGGLTGYVCEREEFVKLLATPTCRQLLGLFFARERARNLSTWATDPSTLHRDPIRRVGVIGAGAMGAGIGQLAAFRGFDVVMKEINEDALNTGRERIEGLFAGLAKRKGWDESMRYEMLGRVRYTLDESAIKDCDLVIEAVVESMAVKKRVFESLDSVVSTEAILASNTSSLSVSEMSTATGRPQLVAGLHFFNPVHRMELVEVVRAAGTDEQTISRMVSFVKALGKTPIVTKDSPGFLVNRVLFPYLGEAVLMVAEGHDIEAVDREIKRFGMPMGPLTLLDQVGLDVALNVANSLDGTLKGVKPVVEQLSALVERGSLGKKSGSGFYEYVKGKKKRVAEMPGRDANTRPIELGNHFVNDGLTPIQRRLVYPMLVEAVKCHDEQVVEFPWAIDLAMVLGTGFAPQRGGPLHVIEQIGLKTVSENLSRMRSAFGQRFAPPKRLVVMADRGQTFHQPEQQSKEPTVH